MLPPVLALDAKEPVKISLIGACKIRDALGARLLLINWSYIHSENSKPLVFAYFRARN